MELIIPEKYDPRLTIRETQDAIKYIRDTFQKEMGREMHLERHLRPLFVEKSSGLNDDLNGVDARFSLIWRACGRNSGGSALSGKMEAHGLKGIRI